MFPFQLPENTILVWRVADIPDEVRLTVSQFIGDTTVWVAFVPPQMVESYISFLQSTSFSNDGGPQSVQTGYGTIYIGNNPL